ncbi:efflux RND transporter periplasmic adaptor subunit [Alterisphingorhabdus coralli]|uniref:Efflux RND transporter periplasmic adaptor subunit n=1 Tax=Alterisphingorhabdus coralli TaxID=3071408 RepID=A0AA97F7E0_9SPHN|nr:efflux RND transporter periplasmic adaptor subunit [Parasphingorhabdus sp. SCSIO 66989]WOE75343.1 efflux RND transporter periplasmic adaptor subunit [Parasphingorhabdus sp. SCSIO 66989]
MALLVALTACGGEKPAEEEPARPAKLFVVQSASNTFDTSFPAIIEASQSSTLAFQVGGLLQDLPIRNGQAVRRGDVLGRLDQRRFRNAVTSAKAQYDAAEAEYQSAVRLLEQDAIARLVVEQRKSQRDTAMAQLDSARKDLADTVLRAPFSGLVAEKHITEFESVSPSQAIVTVQSRGAAEASVSVPASLVPRLADPDEIGGANSNVDEAYVVLSSAPNVKIPGRFLAATTQADTQSQTFKVNFAFDPPSDLIVLPGMTATVYSSRALLRGEGAGKALNIPLGAVISDGKKRSVWVVDTKTMLVKKRTIQVDNGVDEQVRVIAGLKPGETIVAAGAAYLHEGMKIRAYEE